MRLPGPLLLAGFLLAATGLPADAASQDLGPQVPCELSWVEHLGMSCRMPNGLFAVQLEDGLVLHTHGPDPRTELAEEPFEDGAPERPLLCSEGARMEVLYGHPKGSQDRVATVAGDIRAALRRANHLLSEDAAASGGTSADFKVACDAGDIRISSFEGPASGSAAYTEEYGAIVDAARATGHTATETDYLVFYDAGSTVCGVGNLYGDTSLASDNANLVETGYGVVYDGCWEGRTPMHENGHTQGAVQDLAPMWDGSGHCVEGLDVMCYPGEAGVTGTATLGLLYQCSDRVHYDCNFDTYFDAAPEDGEWLATNWNIGDPVNRYLAFGGATLEAPEPEPEPSSSASSTASTSSSSSHSASATKSSSASQTVAPESRSSTTSKPASASVSSTSSAGLEAQMQGAPALPAALAALGVLAAAGWAARRRLDP